MYTQNNSQSPHAFIKATTSQSPQSIGYDFSKSIKLFRKGSRKRSNDDTNINLRPSKTAKTPAEGKLDSRKKQELNIISHPSITAKSCCLFESTSVYSKYDKW